VSVPRLAFVVGLKFGYIIVSKDDNSKGCDHNGNLPSVEASRRDLQPMHNCARASNIVGVHHTTQGEIPQELTTVRVPARMCGHIIGKGILQ